jgi:hypothetical protein
MNLRETIKQMSKEDSFLNDQHFQDVLIGFLIHDREFCKVASHLLTREDFKGIDKNAGNERMAVAGLALDFYNRYRQPLGKMLKVELIEYARKTHWQEASKKKLLDYGDTLTSNGNKRVAPDAALEKVMRYKTEVELSKAIDSMQNQLETGQLSPDEFLKIAREAADRVQFNQDRPTNIFADAELEKRLARRELQTRRMRYPALLIDPLDRVIRIIARKHLGLILAPYKRGKTMLFVWLALAYVLQNLNVLYFTLEDPKEDVEDRFDAAITNLPMSRLTENPDRVRVRFQRYKKYARSKLKVVDGTDGQTSIGKVENIYEQERNKGYMADVVLIDYDDEIQPAKKQSERRMEFADIYRDFRAMLSRHELIGWTASQTSRKSDEMKIISGKYIAEDISKIRKAAFALSLGQGEWGDDSIFLWVAAHRYDRQHVGGNIITNKEKSLFYDREATLLREKQELAKKEDVE